MATSFSNSDSSLIKVLVVYGTRPEIIKLAPVIFSLKNRVAVFETLVCSTGQHFELTAQAESLFGVVPDIDLDLMRPNHQLNGFLARAISAIDRVLVDAKPDWMLVQGDTTTVLAATLAAFHLGIRIGHVEAGLRTYDIKAPFPEEANRSMTDLLADMLFAPTGAARDRLVQEGRDRKRIHVTGNTVVDALQWVSAKLGEPRTDNEVLVTVHRRESFGRPLLDILDSIGTLAERFKDVRWTFPLHHNPNVRGPAIERLSHLDNVDLLEPLSYRELVEVLMRARLVLTDSGGIQEEAPSFGKPVVVLREKTERAEGVAAGVARLVGTDPSTIVSTTSRLLTDDEEYQKMTGTENPYGDGQAASRIVDLLESWLPIDPNR